MNIQLGGASQEAGSHMHHVGVGLGSGRLGSWVAGWVICVRSTSSAHIERESWTVVVGRRAWLPTGESDIDMHMACLRWLVTLSCVCRRGPDYFQANMPGRRSPVWLPSNRIVQTRSAFTTSPPRIRLDMGPLWATRINWTVKSSICFCFGWLPLSLSHTLSSFLVALAPQAFCCVVSLSFPSLLPSSTSSPVFSFAAPGKERT